MSEHAPRHEHEQNQLEGSNEALESAQRERLEQLEAEAKAAAESRQEELENMEEIEEKVEENAVSAESITVETKDAAPEGGMTMLGTQKELKKQAYSKKLKQIQDQLSAPERKLSKAIHQPAINAVSDAGAKTFFRPSGILGGSLMALAGSLVLLYMARHYGFRYNYLIFFMLFAAGWALGILLELVSKPFARHKS